MATDPAVNQDETVQPANHPLRPAISLTEPHLRHLNSRLERMHPADILRFARAFFPGLYQTTAFGLTGLVILDMLSRLRPESMSEAEEAVPVIFLDTLHHFPETLDLIDRVRSRYPAAALHVFRPQDAATEHEFARKYGSRLYETDPERYDWIAKVEPLQRAYHQLAVAAVLTGRRRSQGGARGAIPVLELAEAGGSTVVRINPLAAWSFRQVRAYVDEHQVPYNPLLDRGYRSVGDWHSTSPVADGEDERAGRWRGQAKTECGIHNSRSRYSQYLEEQQQQQAAREMTAGGG